MGGGEIEEDAPRQRLEERPDGTHYLRVIAHGVARMRSIRIASVSTADRANSELRTHTEYGGKG
jgi:hypothetical protein